MMLCYGIPIFVCYSICYVEGNVRLSKFPKIKKYHFFRRSNFLFFTKLYFHQATVVPLNQFYKCYPYAQSLHDSVVNDTAS